MGQRFENIIGRDFTADGPWQKLGTDVTEFKLSFGKAYLAPVYDFASKEIVAHSISMCPNLVQQQEMLQILMDAKPEGANRSCTRIWGGSISTRPTSVRLLIMVLSRVCHVKATASTMALPSRFSDI